MIDYPQNKYADEATRERRIPLVPVPPLDETEQHRGQLRLAERLVAHHQHLLRHVHGVGWYLWDGARWARDLDGAAVRAGIKTVKAAYTALPDLDQQSQQELLSDIRRCESATGLDGMLRLASAMLPIAVSVDKLDADPYLLNTTNGTLDLRTGELRRHDPADLLTKVTGCEYDPGARSAVFDGSSDLSVVTGLAGWSGGCGFRWRRGACGAGSW